MASVLIVEDDWDSAEPLVLFLQRKGHNVVCVPNGREALVALTTSPPDVILLDMRMPVMDGVSFLEVLRSYLRWLHLPVIIVSAVPGGPMLDRAHRFEISKTFRKSLLNYDELEEAIEQVVPAARGGRARMN